MITSVTYKRNDEIAALNEKSVERLNALLEKIGRAYPDDPGTADLYDEQPVSASLNLGDVRLAWRLTR